MSFFILFFEYKIFKFFLKSFGPCFVLKQPLGITAVLELRNRDSVAMSIESQFEKKPYLDFQLSSGQVLLPLQIDKDKKEINVLRVPIIFTPRETIKYDETIVLDINNLHKIEIKLVGEGYYYNNIFSFNINFFGN